ncbi:ATP-binding cassette domain-containing protein [Psychromonas antarctica]|uniref:ATP-binding cassette domain-containing protein n=1 Tax=Psychromonas antarctica TaxID=67573 RepID=UPI001EE84A51|nr:ATP-binding cassette domain-containing protein [Psychromonas antarctica]MCG6201862.1 ATP-binding cassette domain-containing protein [Psychromonas antarctica]
MTLLLNKIAITDGNHKTLISPISFTVAAGEILSLMGPSGCGKSTLLNVIAGHLPHDFHCSGEIYLNNLLLNNTAVEKRNIGLLFQDDLLFPHLNIWQNLAVALPNTVKKSQRKMQAMETLEAINLSFLADNSPAKISGGQRARISMMRMLLAQPAAVLLDEPFNKLDKSLRSEFRDWVFQQIQERKLPALMVTHDQADLPDNGAVLQWPWQQPKEQLNA